MLTLKLASHTFGCLEYAEKFSFVEEINQTVEFIQLFEFPSAKLSQYLELNLSKIVIDRFSFLQKVLLAPRLLQTSQRIDNLCRKIRLFRRLMKCLGNGFVSSNELIWSWLVSKLPQSGCFCILIQMSLSFLHTLDIFY